VNTISKSPNEKFPITFGFSSDLAPGETIASVVVTCVNEATGLSSATDIIDSNTITSSNVAVVIKGGAEGEEHAIQCIATTSFGNNYDRDVKLAVLIDVDASFNKQPGDTFLFDVDFSNRLRSGETVVSAVFAAIQESDGASVYGTIVLAPVIVSPKVGVPVMLGADGETYRIGVLGITSLGYQHEKFVRMNLVEL